MRSGFGNGRQTAAAVALAALTWPAAAAGQIVITEIMQNPSAVSDNDGEWFELHNAGSSDVDINGWKIKDDATATETHTISASGGLSIPAGGYIVLAEEGSSSSNGGITPDYDYSSISLGNGSDGLVLTNASDVEQDRVDWDNGSTFPDPNGASMALKSPDLDNAVGANWCEATTAYGDGDLGTPGAANDCATTPQPFTGAIYAIQGNTGESPHVGATATTEDNIVTAVGAGGFFIQTPTASSDSDADTSDGIFVLYDGTTAIAVGDQVDVTGTVEEFFDFTRIDATTSVTGASVTVDASNQTLPAPVAFGASRPSSDPASPSCAVEYECYEGMRISIATGTVSSGSQHFRSDPVAEMYITPTTSRGFREKGLEYPGDPMNTSIPVWDGNPEVFELDPDKLRDENESWSPGTTFSATGVLGYEFGGYEIWPTELTLLTAGTELPRPVRERAGGEVSVASLNLLNLNPSAGDYETKLEKLSRYIREVLGSPDIIGVQEAFTLAALNALADRIEADDGPSYTAYLEPGNQATGANVGYLVGPDVDVEAVTQHNKTETYVNPVTNANDLLHDRPPLQLDASVTGIAFSVIVIHNRSFIDIDTERVQVKRLEQAQSVARLAQARQDSKLLIVGDFNAYEFTDGYSDIVGVISGDFTASESKRPGSDLVDPNLENLVLDLDAGERYSYSFRGNAQVLDHALVNEEMAESVVEMIYARGNADAAEGEEENASSALYASDHDGFVVFLEAPGRPAPGASDDGPPAGADMSLAAASRIVSQSRVQYEVTVTNAGPATAYNVVVKSTFSGIEGGVEATTSGCSGDPGGVPDCGLGHVRPGESASFIIDVDTGGASEVSLRYRGSAGSDNADPTLDDLEVDLLQPVGPPNAPTDLTAVAIGSTEIELRWTDNSAVETGFDVFLQGPGDSKLRLIGSAPANATQAIVDELVPDIRYRFAVEARNGPLHSRRTPKATATTWFSDGPRCKEDGTLCLDNRFEVEVAWTTADGMTGRGFGELLTAESGDFWFFDPANVEMVVKVLDGCRINGHYWVFAAGLTDVEVTTTVRDVRNGQERIWTNPQGAPFEPIADTSAFATCGDAAAAAAAAVVRLSGAPRGSVPDAVEAAGAEDGGTDPANAGCLRTATALCLQDGRYEVSANWRAGGRSGAAATLPRTADTGMFWFFSSDNVELIVKVLDGCALNGHRWVLMGGLTDVGVEVAVVDSESGKTKRYRSPEAEPFRARFDVTAFPCSLGQ